MTSKSAPGVPRAGDAPLLALTDVSDGRVPQLDVDSLGELPRFDRMLQLAVMGHVRSMLKYLPSSMSLTLSTQQPVVTL